MMTGLSLFAPDNIPLITAGEPLLPVILSALEAQQFTLQDQDVLVIAQKVISKSENRFLDLSTVVPGKDARQYALQCGKDPRFIQAVLDESETVIRCVPGVFLVRHRLGYCLANAGIDQSNIGPVDEDLQVLLLPENPDHSAAQLRSGIKEALNVDVGVVISDSFGRPWRLGTTGVCIGCAGVEPIRDQRGGQDLFGRTLQVTQPAIGDEIAAAASLLMGESTEGRPVVVVRGLSVIKDNLPATQLVRQSGEDLFR